MCLNHQILIIGRYAINVEKLRVFLRVTRKSTNKIRGPSKHFFCKDFVPKKDQQRFSSSQYIDYVHAWVVGIGD